VEKQIRGRFSAESVDVGVDALTPVSKTHYFKAKGETKWLQRGTKQGLNRRL
jgi:hypothetical protein